MKDKNTQTVDVLIVGMGLAGCNMAWHLHQSNKSFIIIDSPKDNICSTVAAGLINPVTGKKLIKTWWLDVFFPYAKDYYQNIEGILNSKYWFDKNIVRPITDTEQFNDVMGRFGDDVFGINLDHESKNSQFDNEIKHKHGFWISKTGGHFQINNFLDDSKKFFQSLNCYFEHWIEEKEIKINSDFVELKEFKAKKIIFCTGFYAAKNGLFKELPFRPTKGEMLKIQSPTLSADFIYNKNGFILSKGIQNEFVTGATFSHNLDEGLTEIGKQQVIEKNDQILTKPYEISEHYYGIRPTVLDRKPLLGKHTNYNNVFIMNGLGSKGTTMAPLCAKWLLDLIFEGIELPKEVDIERYHEKKNQK